MSGKLTDVSQRKMAVNCTPRIFDNACCVNPLFPCDFQTRSKNHLIFYSSRRIGEALLHWLFSIKNHSFAYRQTNGIFLMFEQSITTAVCYICVFSLIQQYCYEGSDMVRVQKPSFSANQPQIRMRYLFLQMACSDVFSENSLKVKKRLY